MESLLPITDSHFKSYVSVVTDGGEVINHMVTNTKVKGVIYYCVCNIVKCHKTLQIAILTVKFFGIFMIELI
jgi:hypothetical protein